MIKVDNVSYTYNADTNHPVTALSAVSLQMEPGEFLAIVGHNGSGKSTLSKLLGGLLVPTEGVITVDGIDTRDLDRRRELHQRIGMVFQNPDNQIIGTTVEDDVAFGPENIGLAPALTEARVEEALALLGLQSARHEPPHLLSGSQKQRVAIAGVVAMRPHYIVLDEPTALLDPTGREEVLAAVVRLCRQEGAGVILVTHFMDEVVAADRVLVMDGGKPVMTGTPRQIFAQVERLRELRLDVPLVSLVAEGLRERGIAAPPGMLDIEELIRCLWASK